MRRKFWLLSFIIFPLAIGILNFKGYQIKGFIEEKIRQFSLPKEQSFKEFQKKNNDEIVKEPILNLKEKELINEPALSDENKKEKTVLESEKLPLEFNLAVPFTSQAPLGQWNENFKEACEEASIIMIDAFFKERKLSKKSVAKEILDLEEWEEKHLGSWRDASVQKVAFILKERYGYQKVNIIENPTIEIIKQSLYNGFLIIAPTAGRLLNNPYFRQPGPLYHMLVIRGWTKDNLFITNDPGTKRGNGYLYEPKKLLEAIHDLNEEEITKGRKVIIVVKP
jgi:hypothetical protein